VTAAVTTSGATTTAHFFPLIGPDAGLSSIGGRLPNAGRQWPWLLADAKASKARLRDCALVVEPAYFEALDRSEPDE